MPDVVTLPIICAANLCNCAKWFVYLKKLMIYPLLKEDERYLWLWLATQCADNYHLVCSFNYEQISHAINKPPKVIHRLLFRLRALGFLMGDIPIWYAAPSLEMIKEMRTFRLLVPLAYHGSMNEKNGRGGMSALFKRGHAGERA